MHSKADKKRNIILTGSAFLLGAVFFLLYFFRMPMAVQGGDTGELVTNSYLLKLLHPPGFPVYFWLQWLFTHFIPWGTVFYKGSMLSLASSIFCLVFLQNKAGTKNSAILIFIFLSLLGLNSVYSQYSILPDVFLLQGPFILLFLHFSEKKSDVWATLFLALALGVHPIAIFLVPIWFLQISGIKWKQVILFIATCALIYSSLLMVRSTESFAWRPISNLSDFFHYFLRKDYGTLKLGSGESGFYLFQQLSFLFKQHWLILAACVSVISSVKDWRNSFEIKLLGTIVLYVLIFFSLVNFPPTDFSGEVIQRFHLFGLFLLAYFGVSKLNSMDFKLSIFSLFIAVALLQLLTLKLPYFSSTLERYAEDLLKVSESPSCSLLVTDSDSTFGALNYLQSVEGFSKNTVVAAKGFLLMNWYQEQLEKKGISVRPQKVGELVLDQDLILPNVNKCKMIFEFIDISPMYKVTFHSLGREVSAGNGIATEESLPLRQMDFPIASSSYSLNKRIFSRYADIFLLRGITSLNQGKWKEARDSFDRAISVVPYCGFAWKNLCLLDKAEKKAGPACQNEFLEDSYCNPRRP